MSIFTDEFKDAKTEKEALVKDINQDSDLTLQLHVLSSHRINTNIR